MVPIVLGEALLRWTALTRAERVETCRMLRMLGLSYGEISVLTGTPRGTAHKWCGDIVLDQEQFLALSLPGRSKAGGRVAAGVILRSRAEKRRSAIRDQAKGMATNDLHDPLWMAGLIAYWSEGAKTSRRLQFTNSDPDLVRLFIFWSTRFLEVTPDELRVQLHLHSGQDEEATIGEWSTLLAISRRNFYKSYIKASGTGHRKTTLSIGTASVRVARSSDRLQIVLGWIDAFRASGLIPLNSVRAAGATGSAADS